MITLRVSIILSETGVPLCGYTEASAGDWHSLLLRSDGKVVAGGCNLVGQCSIPEMEVDTQYVSNYIRPIGNALLQAEFKMVSSSWSDSTEKLRARST